MRHKLFGIVVLFVVACSGRVETPHATAAAGTDAGPAAVEAVDATVDAVEAVPEAAGDVVDPKGEATADFTEKETSLLVPAPTTIAEKFVAAGGQKLCLAMVYQLNPEWRMDACDHQRYDDAAKAADQRAACTAQRDPLRQFADTVCTTVIVESLRLDLDPAMVLAVIKRESAFGRVSRDHTDQSYVVSTDVCKLTLPKSRIVSRRPDPRRPGVELASWTFGPQAPQAGAVARNHQPVRVISEDDTTVTFNTCAAGEGGLMQTVPHELQTAGTTIGLTGTLAQRRAAVDADPVLQVRVGCQALADARDAFSEEQRGDFVTWLHGYNDGTTTPGSADHGYTAKILRHYLDACDGYLPADDGGMPTLVQAVWPECARLADVYHRMPVDE